MSEPLTIVLAGINGYGRRYLNAILNPPAHANIKLIATVDPFGEKYDRLGELRKKGVLHFNSLQEFYQSHTADLLVIASPIQLHAEQICLALQHGSNVLCEKPLCCSTEDAARIANMQRRFNRHVTVAFQWSFSGAMQELKADILAGRFGAPKRLRCMALWPRDQVYYQRNDWAGKIKDSIGRAVFDSPVNNACAHCLHNLLHVIGPTVYTSANPLRVEAELFRANPIENYDTAVLRCYTDAGIPLLFVTSHATRNLLGPMFYFEFENAVLHYHEAPHAVIKVTFETGSSLCYGCPTEPDENKLWRTIETIRSNKPSWSSIEAATSHTHAVAMAQQSPRGIISFPKRLIRRIGQPPHETIVVQGLDSALKRCYDGFALPSELGIAWATKPALRSKVRLTSTPSVNREVAV